MTKKTAKIALFAAAIGTAYFTAGCHNGGKSGGDSTAHYQSVVIPTNVAPACAVSPAQLNSWFLTGTAAANGFVLPANSATFPANASDSNFYKWSEQMFLWITSREADNTLVLENNAFFMVLPDSADQNRELIQCTPGIFKTVGHIKNFAGHNTTIVQDKKGKMWRVLNEEKNAPGQGIVATDNGMVKAVRIENNAAGGHKFFDAKGAEIVHPHAAIAGKPLGKNEAKKVTINGRAILLSADGEVDADAETAQASGNALIAQNGSMVHYILFVNDFYAYYLTGQKSGAFKGTKIDTLLPTDTIGRNLVCRYARNVLKKTIIDSNALAMELKTSWVEINESLLDSGNMISATATVPTFNKITNNVWVQDSTKTKRTRIALIGMHILGSAYGHPEMIWSTFEHQNNAPNAAYIYKDSAGVTMTHPADPIGGKWLLDDSTGSNENLNGLTASRAVGLDSVYCSSPLTVGKRNVRRQAPWGNFDSTAANTNATAQNTMVMSLNNSVRGQINALGSDIRTKYMLVGALWTAGGVVPNPTGAFQELPDTVNSRGGIQLANATMETYMLLSNEDGGCFDCHNSSLNPAAAFELSHIFSAINPLPIPPATISGDTTKKTDTVKKHK